MSSLDRHILLEGVSHHQGVASRRSMPTGLYSQVSARNASDFAAQFQSALHYASPSLRDRSAPPHPATSCTGGARERGMGQDPEGSAPAQPDYHWITREALAGAALERRFLAAASATRAQLSSDTF